MAKVSTAPDFPISMDQCRLLLTLETTGSVREAAESLRRDVSVVSRQIAEIARDPRTAGLVEKLGGRWQVSLSGRRMNLWTRDAILSQGRVLAAQVSLRIATTREFAARVLAPRLADLIGDDLDLQISVIVSEDGVEPLLLAGEADIGLDCGRPTDPAIRFRRVIPEPFAIIAAPSLVSAGRPRTLQELLALPHLRYHRLSPSRALQLPFELGRTRAVFNDLAALRAACCAGLGWAITPRYVAQRELDDGQLVELSPPDATALEPEHFGVWWLRERTVLEAWAKRAVAWLKQQAL